MSERRTRRQAAMAAANETPTKSDALRDLDGNGDAHVSPAPKTTSAGPAENIFLFWPNLIGECPGRFPLHARRRRLTLFLARVFPHRIGRRIIILHAAASANMLPTL